MYLSASSFTKLRALLQCVRLSTARGPDTNIDPTSLSKALGENDTELAKVEFKPD
jgi:hypothetical protein